MRSGAAIQLEPRLELELRNQSAQTRDQKRRLLWGGATAASYAVDTLFLGMFAVAGTVEAVVPLVYGILGVAICVATYWMTATGINLRAPDPNLTAPLTGVGVAMQLGVVAAAPQIAFPYLANLFTVFAFGMIWMSVRQSIAVWTMGTLATGVLFYVSGEQLAMPVATPFERALVWTYFSLILGRCLLLSVQSNDQRRRLSEGRSRLSATLEQVQLLASHDELTRVYNRRTLIERLEQERSRAQRTGVPFSVLLLDLDHFKAVNDEFGHGAGDEVLKAFAAKISAAVRDSDVFGRYGGEEFLAILNATGPAAAHPAIARMRAAVEAHDWTVIAAGLQLTFSGGLAGFRADEMTAQLLNRADQALYEAKGAGRNRVIVKE